MGALPLLDRLGRRRNGPYDTIDIIVDARTNCDVHRRGTLRWKGHRSCGRDLNKPDRAGKHSHRTDRDRIGNPVIGRDDETTDPKRRPIGPRGTLL